MEGRGDDTKGIARAADLLEQRYKSLGLEPAGTQGLLSAVQRDYRRKLAGNNHVGGAGGRREEGSEAQRGFRAVQLFFVRVKRARRSYLRVTAPPPTNFTTTITAAST